MKLKKSFIYTALITTVLLSHSFCQQHSKMVVNAPVIENETLNEASGIAASQYFNPLLWTHNDSGDKARLFALNASGGDIGTVTLAGVENRDWEDIAIGPGPVMDSSYIYIGEIGDNRAQYAIKYIYRFPEPQLNDKSRMIDRIITEVDRIAFRYPDGPRDAETLMIDPENRDIYIVSKREDQNRLYRLPYPQSTDTTIIAEMIRTLPLTSATAGDISSDGRHIVVKNYEYVYYWHREPGQSLGDALSASPKTLPYQQEPQGEALCWNRDVTGYYTISEQKSDQPVRIYYYEFSNPVGQK